MFLWEFIVKDMLFWFFGRNFILFIFYIKSVNPLHELRQRKLENISIQNASSFYYPNEKYLMALYLEKKRKKKTYRPKSCLQVPFATLYLPND